MSDTYAEAIWGVLDRNYGSVRHGKEMLARAADVVPRTAKNWLERKNAPRGDELVRLMAADVRVAETMRDLVLRQREELRRRQNEVKARHASLGRDLFVGRSVDLDARGQCVARVGGAADGLG